MTSSSSDRGKILVVSHNGQFVSRLTDLLVANGYEVSSAPDSDSGFKRMGTVMPHFIVVDNALLGLSGDGILKAKQSEPLLAKIPVLIVSVDGSPMNFSSVPARTPVEFTVALDAGLSEVINHIKANFKTSPAQRS